MRPSVGFPIATDWFTNGCLQRCLMYSRNFYEKEGYCLYFILGSYVKPHLGNKIQRTTKSQNLAQPNFFRRCLRNLQMSFWGATVITNMLSAIPYIGTDLVYFVWGGFSVDNPTLNRFFSLHFLLPFLLAALAIIHIIFLHVHGSNNPLGIASNMDKLPIHPYYAYKDYFGFIIFGIIFALILFFYPNLLGHSDNYIPANPLVTPEHIVPEWLKNAFH